MRSFRHVANCSMRMPMKLAAFLLVLSIPACGKEPSGPRSEAFESSLVITAVSPVEIFGSFGRPVEPLPTVIVKTPGGQPVPGISVNFDVGDGAIFDGSVAKPVAVTNAVGIATPGEWKLARRMDKQDLLATIVAAGRPRSVIFRVQAFAEGPTQLGASFNAINQVGLPGWPVNAPDVRLLGKSGGGVALSGVPVSFVLTAGGGRLEKTEVRTDVNGYASAGGWTLGPNAGVNSVVASVANVGTVTITAQALDARVLTWYDLESIDNRSSPAQSGSIGLGENGSFVGETFYGTGVRRWLGGQYRVSGTEFIFERLFGNDGSRGDGPGSTLIGDRLSILWCPVGSDCGYTVADELRKYKKR